MTGTLLRARVVYNHVSLFPQIFRALGAIPL